MGTTTVCSQPDQRTPCIRAFAIWLGRAMLGCSVAALVYLETEVMGLSVTTADPAAMGPGIRPMAVPAVAISAVRPRPMPEIHSFESLSTPYRSGQEVLPVSPPAQTPGDVPLDLPVTALPLPEVYEPPSRLAGAQVEVQPFTPLPRPPVRIVAPSIDLDSPVVNAPLVTADGVKQWQVPPFVVGHAERTANPGQKGNVVLLGHVESRNMGSVFKHLLRMAVDDEVWLYTEDAVYLYRVESVQVVAREQVDVVKSRGEPTATLITCTGTWMPLVKDYDRRAVVVARLEGVHPLGEDP